MPAAPCFFEWFHFFEWFQWLEYFNASEPAVSPTSNQIAVEARFGRSASIQ
jgi:hypothetical protein